MLGMGTLLSDDFPPRMETRKAKVLSIRKRYLTWVRRDRSNGDETQVLLLLLPGPNAAIMLFIVKHSNRPAGLFLSRNCTI